MEDVIRIHCPPATYNQHERVRILFEEIEKWVTSSALQELIGLYDETMPTDMNLKERINWLNKFVNIWDFRKKQSNGGERWMVANDEKCEHHQDLILYNAGLLGLVNSEIPSKSPDYILPLGGARLANLARAQGAREMADLFIESHFSIVALTGKRPLNEIELPFIAEYAPNAKNEYDAMNSGLENVFSLADNEYFETNYMTENCNLRSSKREYAVLYKGHKIYSLAAPSADPARRANSLDTFYFFMNEFKVSEKQRLLLVTSCIYVPFQLLKFIPISFKQNIEVDCYGVSPSIAGSQFSKASNYLQEVKGVVNAIQYIASLFL